MARNPTVICVACKKRDHQQCLGGICECIHYDDVSSSEGVRERVSRIRRGMAAAESTECNYVHLGESDFYWLCNLVEAGCADDDRIAELENDLTETKDVMGERLDNAQSELASVKAKFLKEQAEVGLPPHEHCRCPQCFQALEAKVAELAEVATDNYDTWQMEKLKSAELTKQNAELRAQAAPAPCPTCAKSGYCDSEYCNCKCHAAPGGEGTFDRDAALALEAIASVGRTNSYYTARQYAMKAGIDEFHLDGTTLLITIADYALKREAKPAAAPTACCGVIWNECVLLKGYEGEHRFWYEREAPVPSSDLVRELREAIQRGDHTDRCATVQHCPGCAAGEHRWHPNPACDCWKRDAERAISKLEAAQPSATPVK